MRRIPNKLNFSRRQLVIFINRRRFGDPIAWVVFLMLTIGFSTLHLLNEYFIKQPNCELLDFIVTDNCENSQQATPLDAFLTVLKSSVIYMFIMMVPIYFNLNVLKKNILDRKVLRVWTYSPYLIAVILNAILFAWIILLIGKFDSDLMRVELRFWLHVLTFFGAQLVSTGLLYRRETLDYIRQIEKIKKKEQRILEENLELRERLEDVEIAGSKNVLIIGKKKDYKIIALEDIMYLQGGGNLPFIYTVDGKKHWGSDKLGKYQEFLPTDQFIQVHRSFIVRKDKVIARKGDELVLEGGTIKIPISKSYESVLESDERIGFQPELNQKSSKKEN